MHAGVQGEGRRAVDGVARLVFVGDRGGRTGRMIWPVFLFRPYSEAACAA